jgi:hypothetical protein
METFDMTKVSNVSFNGPSADLFTISVKFYGKIFFADFKRLNHLHFLSLPAHPANTISPAYGF